MSDLNVEQQLVNHNRATMSLEANGDPTYLSEHPWEGIQDPCLRSVASNELSADQRRWLTYADRELARLREKLELVDPSYRLGVCCYEGEILAGDPLQTLSN